MTDNEKQFFDRLTKKSENFANYLDDPQYQGVKRTVVDKYSDQAHFVYELLQNADDAEAKKAKFVLKEDGLYFYHNGKIPFTVSDPDIKETDKNKIGHINAITSIGNSSKEEKSNTIGKFGVGFKSVFQYTDTPHIFDNNFRFKIERFIVPRLLVDDIQREETDTAFYFPFDKKGMEPRKAYSEILGKLKSLIYPTLFLSCLKEVEWTTGEENGTYLIDLKLKEEINGIESNLIEVLNEVNHKDNNESLLLFERKISESEHRISIGFFLDESNSLKPAAFSAFCFFPTKEETKLRFIINGPFLLTDSREGIKASEEWNLYLIEELSTLVADSLIILKKKKLINDNIINIIPYRENDFIEIGNSNRISFKPFYNAIKGKLKTETLLPTRDGSYTDKSHAYWADAEELVNLFSDDQLSQLVDDPDAKWIFTSIGRTKDSDITQYIDGGDDRSWVKKEPNLISENMTPEKILKKITSEFIEKQSFVWLCKLYEYLLERKSYQSFVKNIAIFLSNKQKAVPAFDNKNQLILFLPAPEESEYITIHDDFLKHEIAMKFFEAFGITKPNLKNEIYNIIIPKYRADIETDTGLHFMKIFSYYKDCPSSQLSEFLALLRTINFIHFKLVNNGCSFQGNAESIYFPSSDMEVYFEINAETRFLDIEFYHKLAEKLEYSQMEEFLLKLGVSRYPRIIEKNIATGSYRDMFDKYIDGCENLLNNINKKRSIALWNILIAMIKEKGNVNFLMGQHRAGRWESFESSELKRLREKSWLFSKDNKIVSPLEVTIDDLSEEYDKIGDDAISLVKVLQISENATANQLATEFGVSVDAINFLKAHPDGFEKFRQFLNRRKRPGISNRPELDRDRRRDAMTLKNANADDKVYEIRQRRVRISSISSGASKAYLESYYTYDDGTMFCQICGEEMPFKKCNGEYYYEAVEILPREYLPKENEEQYLALCPECSARYNEYLLHGDHSIMEELKNHIINGTDMELHLGDISENDHEPFVKSIYFEKSHLIDLKTILEGNPNG